MTGDTAVGRGTVAAVATSAALAALGLANPVAGQVFWTHAAGYGGIFMGSLDGPAAWPLSAAVAAVIGLLVFQRFRSSGWAWLTLVGALLTLAAGLAMAIRSVPISLWWFPPALGAGSALLIVGLLGAANWLIRASGVAAAAAVVTAACTVPVLAQVTVGLLQFGRNGISPVNWIAWVTGIGAVAAGALVFATPVLRRVELQAPPALLTAAGSAAALLALAPELASRFGGQQFPPLSTTTGGSSWSG